MKLAETAGQSLSSMESVSAQLAKFIHNVALAAKELNALAEETRQNMTAIKKVANQNVAGTRQATILVGELADKAKQQIQGIKNFTLPGQTPDKEA
jgi:methyl-accepting chemotaxis protein